MRITGLLVATFVAAVLLAVSRSAPGTAFEPSGSRGLASLSTRQSNRLRAHFDSVDGVLRQANTSSLGKTQRASRAELIDWLRDYRNAGRFPRNDGFPDRAMPFFRDSRGTLCAMAYLIARSGRSDIVNRIARTRNNAYIAELADDLPLGQWLDSVGLTASEAALIQPTYGYNPEDKSSVSASYVVASIAASGAAATTMGFNVLRPSIESGLVGLLAGGAAILTGLARMPSEGGRHTVAVTNIVVGAGAMVLGIRGLVEAANRRSRSRPSERAQGFGFALAPALVPAHRPAFGLVIQARF